MSSKRNYRKKSKSEDNQENENITEKDDVSDEVSETIEELIELRKFRRRHQGIDAEKLMKGETRAKKKKKDEDPWKLTTGGIVDLEAVRAAEKMAYIEEEMRKRRGQISVSKNDVEDAEQTDPLNPQDELFQAPDHLRIESRPISEGNVQLSTTMLTAIPEVDLGIDVRLKNIEETEKAKRKLLEQRHQKPKEEDDTFEGSNFSATNRFYRTRSTVSDHERNQQEQLNQPHYKAGQRREMATDDIVAERFKKRLRR
ncbi:4089_t:CDS:2 [Dentiscutata erythropus]|uniref:4089_t:CDS:1 n=1 Tax=Dentiscutata erythropus TaxID=1348616 RepID=A0A9N9DDU8_9GLOM|nr:4089_t:CDS:2 [Dentiscutata erythropus]